MPRKAKVMMVPMVMPHMTRRMVAMGEGDGGAIISGGRYVAGRAMGGRRPKGSPPTKKPTAYNNFVKAHVKKGEAAKLQMKAIGAQWKALSEAEKASYK